MPSGRVRRRQRPPELRVVLDTNAIYTQSECFLVKQEVSELIREGSQHLDLVVSWHLPEIVRHERQYQMTKQSLELLPSIQKLERILGHKLNITADIIKRGIQDVIDQQIQALKLQLLTIESTNVDWNAMMLNAAYRRAPFSAGEKEKGFRDALIAEAFVQLVSGSPQTPTRCRIALITADGLLKEAIEARTSDAANVRVLPTIEELRGLINTLVSKVSEDFVESIKSKAETYFFKPQDSSTLFYKEKIWEVISKKFRTELSSVPPGAQEREQVSTTIGPPRFVRKQGQRVFWATRITEQAKAYKYESGSFTEGRYFGAGSVSPSALVSVSPSASVLPSASVSPSFQIRQDNPLVARLVGGSLEFEHLFPVSQGLRIQKGLLTSPSLTRSLFKSGELVFEVTWSVAVTTSRRLTKPVIESVEYLESQWG